MAMHAAVLPGQELAGLRKELAPRYGARVVDEGDRKILVIRVPRAEPDPVLDVEACIDVLDPRDTEDITHCILVGDTRASQVYARPIQDLMAERVAFDRAQAAEWRGRLPGRSAFQLYRSPADPRRRWRLAVRLPCESVKQLEESHLEELADQIGTQLVSPRFQELAAVYLIASTDDVRMEADVFIQELRKVHEDEERRRRMAREIELKTEAERRRREDERNMLLGELKGRFDVRRPAPSRDRAVRTAPPTGEARAPRSRAQEVLDKLAATAAEPQVPTPLLEREDELGTRAPGPEAPRAQGSGPGAEIDRLAAPLQAIAADRRKADSLQARVDALTRRAQEIRPGEPLLEGVARAVQHFGYDVIIRPETPFAIDLAAERPQGDPQRIVFRIVDRLTDDVAGELLRTARELEVDHVFCVAEQADDAARRRLVATKVTWCRPHELRSLRL